MQTTLYRASGTFAYTNSPADFFQQILNPPDMVSARFDVISFFLLGFLIASFVMRWVWNSLRKDWPRLPEIGYRTALAGMFVWGVAALLILTMISGARELMTPGAWKKVGLTYQLSQEVDAEEARNRIIVDVPSMASRVGRLQEIRRELWSAAEANGGRTPADRKLVKVPVDHWQMPGEMGVEYEYRGDVDLGGEPKWVVLEWAIYSDSPPLELLSDGSIRVHDVLPAAKAEALPEQSSGTPIQPVDADDAINPIESEGQ
ncbi:MAG: hypothetical protein R3C01_05245 [Planctomycetaceae bacterium]